VTSNLKNLPVLRFVPVTSADYNVVAGAAGYVDTDCSATVGTNKTKRVWLIHARNADGTPVGARANGSAVDCKVNQNNTSTLMSTASASGHIDLYRNAATAALYTIFGYLEVT